MTNTIVWVALVALLKSFCLHIYRSIHVCLSVFIWPSVCVSNGCGCLCWSDVYLCVCLSICLPVCLLQGLAVTAVWAALMATLYSVYLSVYRFVCCRVWRSRLAGLPWWLHCTLSFCVSVYQSVYLFVYCRVWRARLSGLPWWLHCRWRHLYGYRWGSNRNRMFNGDETKT